MTAKGVSQALDASPIIRSAPPPTLCVVSPLRRATQTALLAFSHVAPGSSRSAVWEAWLECAEESNGCRCDIVSDPAVLKGEFGGIEYASIPFNSASRDAELIAPGVPLLESKMSLIERCSAFLSRVKESPHKVIAVGTHSQWLQALHVACLDTDEECLEESVEWYGTGELRAVDIRFNKTS